MGNKSLRQRSLFSWPQVLILLTVVAALLIALDLNRRAEAGRQVGAGKDELQGQVVIETTRQVELQATLDYVQSEDYIEDFARTESGQVLPGERRVVPLVIEVTPTPLPAPTPTPDPAAHAEPWQAWWRLLTDAPQPQR
jgi:Ni/Co efflux regulator RcnB